MEKVEDTPGPEWKRVNRGWRDDEFDGEFERFTSIHGEMITRRTKPPKPQWREVEVEVEVPDKCVFRIVDNGILDENGKPTVIFFVGESKDPPGDAPREVHLAHYDRRDALKLTGLNWLAKHFPDYHKVEAYWDDDIQHGEPDPVQPRPRRVCRSPFKRRQQPSPRRNPTLRRRR
jgi:hypothetical protein